MPTDDTKFPVAKPIGWQGRRHWHGSGEPSPQWAPVLDPHLESWRKQIAQMPGTFELRPIFARLTREQLTRTFGLAGVPLPSDQTIGDLLFALYGINET